jgi:acetylglutamate kinase
MKNLRIIKIGGNVIDHPELLNKFVKDFSKLKGAKILVHGGGKLANKLASDLGYEAKLVDGRRITDEKTLEIVTMVYAGLVNKNIVAKLQAENCNALGLSGADGNSIKAVKRPVKEIDYGFVGDIPEDAVNANLLNKLISDGFVPVFSAITHDGSGQLLNTNADTIASVLAVALSKFYTCSLIYCFEKKGVLENVSDENSVIKEIKSSSFIPLQQQGVISDGMIPKIHNSFEAINKGVKEVLIGASHELALLETNTFGTRLLK